jgi:hypothetical protein
LIRPTISNFSSSFLQQRLLWMNTQHPYSMVGVVRVDATILSLSPLTTRLVYIANVSTRPHCIKNHVPKTTPFRCGMSSTLLSL